MNLNWDAVTAAVTKFVVAAEPIVNAAVAIAAPEAAAAVSIGEKIIQGVIAEEPSAKSLYDQIIAGTPVTQAQVAALEADYEEAYQETKDDIAAALADLPPQ